MNKGELLDMLVKQTKVYRNSGVIDSIKRNKHMNNFRDESINLDAIDAILVDFVNYMCILQGVDLGLYANDLKEI